MTAREPLEPSAESAVYRKALTWGAIALGVLAVVAAVVGWLVDGAMGAWAAPAGVALAALAGLLTPWAMQLRGPAIRRTPSRWSPSGAIRFRCAGPTAP